MLMYYSEFSARLGSQCINRFLTAHAHARPECRADGDHWALIENPEPKRIRNRDANEIIRWLKKAAPGPHYTKSEFRHLCTQYNNRCLRCRRQLPSTADHVIPLSSGGSGAISNIQPLCRRCNGRKSLNTTDYRPRYKAGSQP
jgi:5-methylcytosine-specific restriction endonuclease McrA